MRKYSLSSSPCQGVLHSGGGWDVLVAAEALKPLSMHQQPNIACQVPTAKQHGDGRRAVCSTAPTLLVRNT